jgi:release factor glutamine methyltransferase
MGGAFAKKGLDSPRLIAEILLSHVLGCDRLRLAMDADRPATPLERESLRDLVQRALNHEPIHYLVNEKWFYGLPMHVDKRVLIPRPATETIVETLLRHAKAQPGFGGPRGEGVLIADVCTGSGCIAVAALHYLKGARAIATDISPEALEVAQRNARRHGVAERLELLHGDLLTPLLAHPAAGKERSLHFLVSNPPYIPDHEWAAVAPNVKNFEPEQALRAGPDGLLYVRPVIERAPPLLVPGGLLLVEVADSCAEAALEIARSRPELENAEILQDFEGLPRVVAARRAAGTP